MSNRLIAILFAIRQNPGRYNLKELLYSLCEINPALFGANEREVEEALVATIEAVRQKIAISRKAIEPVAARVTLIDEIAESIRGKTALQVAAAIANRTLHPSLTTNTSP